MDVERCQRKLRKTDDQFGKEGQWEYGKLCKGFGIWNNGCTETRFNIENKILIYLGHCSSDRLI